MANLLGNNCVRTNRRSPTTAPVRSIVTARHGNQQRDPISAKRGMPKKTEVARQSTRLPLGEIGDEADADNGFAVLARVL